MTKLLEKAVERLSRLPESEQNREAQAILDRLDRTAVPDETSGSAYDLIEDLVGRLEGPGDMSHNPAYLADLGASSV